MDNHLISHIIAMKYYWVRKCRLSKIQQNIVKINLSELNKSKIVFSNICLLE